jgi:hypothetical protein
MMVVMMVMMMKEMQEGFVQKDEEDLEVIVGLGAG